MTASSINIFSYVEVNFWLAKDKEGKTTTSLTGGLQSKFHRGTCARCGHGSLTVVSDTTKDHASLWPEGELINENNEAIGVFAENLDEDIESEGSLPDVIIRLYHLNIKAIQEAIHRIKERIARGEIAWVYEIEDNKDITDPKNTRANCATLVYSLLKIGGFEDKRSLYYQHIRSTGPRDKEFYKITKCDSGDILKGIFNGAPWTHWRFTPKALLLHVASAAEAYHEDKNMTKYIMTKKTRVFREKSLLDQTTETVSQTLGIVIAPIKLIKDSLFRDKNNQKEEEK